MPGATRLASACVRRLAWPALATTTLLLVFTNLAVPIDRLLTTLVVPRAMRWPLALRPPVKNPLELLPKLAPPEKKLLPVKLPVVALPMPPPVPPTLMPPVMPPAAPPVLMPPVLMPPVLTPPVLMPPVEIPPPLMPPVPALIPPAVIEIPPPPARTLTGPAKAGALSAVVRQSAAMAARKTDPSSE